MAGIYITIAIVGLITIFGLLLTAGALARLTNVIKTLIDTLAEYSQIVEPDIKEIKRHAEYSACGERFNILLQVERVTRQINQCIAEERYEDVAKLKQRLQEYNKFLGIKL